MTKVCLAREPDHLEPLALEQLNVESTLAEHDAVFFAEGHEMAIESLDWHQRHDHSRQFTHGLDEDVAFLDVVEGHATGGRHLPRPCGVRVTDIFDEIDITIMGELDDVCKLVFHDGLKKITDHVILGNGTRVREQGNPPEKGVLGVLVCGRLGAALGQVDHLVREEPDARIELDGLLRLPHGTDGDGALLCHLEQLAQVAHGVHFVVDVEILAYDGRG